MNDPAASAAAPVREAAGVDDYDFASPSVRFGSGRVVEAGAAARLHGHTAWLVTGRRADSPAAAAVWESVEAAGMACEWIAAAAGEPTVDDVVRGLRAVAGRSADGVVVIGVGGGAAIDLAKAIAALVRNGLEEAITVGAGIDAAIDACVVDHLEGVGRGLALDRAPLPIVAVPTTAGTGSEATRNAVISCPRRRFKKSLRSPLLVPRAAIVDPRLSATCPPEVAAACGMDAITQLVEAYVSRFRRPIPRALVRESLPRAIHALPVVVRAAGEVACSGTVERAREAIGHAALCSGLALANSGLGLAHGVAAALGAECGTAHGVACGLLLPTAIRVNLRACEADFAALERRCEAVAPTRGPGPVGGDDADAARRFLERIERLRETVGIPATLAAVGLPGERLGWLAENSGGASMRGNPVELSRDELLAQLERIRG